MGGMKLYLCPMGASRCNRWIPLGVLLGAAALLFAAVMDLPASTRRCELEVCFEPMAKLGEADIPLKGVGLFRLWGFKVYVAGYYGLGSSERQGVRAATDGPKRLRIHYLRSIDKNDLIKAAEVHLAQTPGVDVASLRSRLDRIHASYQSVQAGDEYELRYVPTEGTTLLFNGKPVVTLPGEDFAQAYFGLWVGANPLSDGLRDRLLGVG